MRRRRRTRPRMRSQMAASSARQRTRPLSKLSRKSQRVAHLPVPGGHEHGPEPPCPKKDVGQRSCGANELPRRSRCRRASASALGRDAGPRSNTAPSEDGVERARKAYPTNFIICVGEIGTSGSAGTNGSAQAFRWERLSPPRKRGRGRACRTCTKIKAAQATQAWCCRIRARGPGGR